MRSSVPKTRPSAGFFCRAKQISADSVLTGPHLAYAPRHTCPSLSPLYELLRELHAGAKGVRCGGGHLMSARRRPGQNLQRALVDHLRARVQPTVYWFHPVNGGACNAIEGAILKDCGVRAGTPI